MLVGLILAVIGAILFLMFAVSNDDIYKYLAAFFVSLGFLVLLCVGMFQLGRKDVILTLQLEQQKIEQQKLIEELGLSEEQLELLRK